MEVVVIAISLIGAAGIVGCIIWLIVNAIRKRPKKHSFIGIGISVVLFLVGCIPVNVGASATMQWSKSDFSFYDQSGKEIAFPIKGESISLSDTNKSHGSNLKTKYDVQIGDRATSALDKYDIDNFYYAVTNFWGDGSATDKQCKKEDQEFHSKYKTFSEALKHSDEIDSTGLVLFASMKFYPDGERLIPYELNKAGNPKKQDFNKDCYEAYFIIENEKIKDINFEIKKGFKH